MPAIAVNPPYPLFTDADGQPLDDAYIYIGTANQNPVSNPITVYWDSALTITAAQPIRTSGGYPVYNGTPARFYTNSDYSILVRDKNGAFIYTAASETDFISSEFVTFIQSGTGAVNRSVQDKLRDSVSVKDFGAVGNGVDDDTSAIQTAIDTGQPVYIPAGIYKITASLQLSGLNTIYGDGSQKTTLLVDDQITGIRGTGSHIYIESLHVRCNRNNTNTWASTSAKGIYIKNGPDNTASNPTAYLENIYIRDVLVSRFYESIEVDGAYWVQLRDVQTIWDFTGLIFNRNSTSGFTGTTLELHRVWCRGNGGTYSSPVGSMGFSIWDYTNLHVFGCGSERYESIGQFRTIQGAEVIDCYFEYAKFGPRFHTMSGRCNVGGVYYNNVGNAYSAGGWTIRVEFGTLNYRPSRFITTDHSAQIETSGKIFLIGYPAFTSTSGASSSEYRYIDYAGTNIGAVNTESIGIGGNQIIDNYLSIGNASGVDDSVTLTFNIGVGSDWRMLTLNILAINNRNNSGSAYLVHNKILTFAYIQATSTITAQLNADIYKSSTDAITLVSQSISGSTITIVLNLQALSGGSWNGMLSATAMAPSLSNMTIS